MSKEMYGLFERHYDYYEFETLICVSKDKEKLKERYNSLDNKNKYKSKLIPQSQYGHYSEKEITHFQIVKVELI